MKGLNERADVLWTNLQRLLMAVFSSEGFLFVILYLLYGVLETDLFLSHRDIVDPLRDYVIMPLSGVLLGACLMREKRPAGFDVRMLFVLILWLSVPFILRFGTEYFTMRSVYGYSICFFVLYASVCGSDARRRGQQLNIACAGIGLISLVLGGMLLYCAWTGKVYYSYPGTTGFGVVNGQLFNAMHYNDTGKTALTCMLFCLTGLCRSRKKPVSILYLLGIIMMALVVILTQSRTARYAMLGVLALGTWNGLSEYLTIRRGWLRQGVALMCAAVVLVGGYWLCARIMDAALAHYAGKPSQVMEAVIPSAVAEEDAKQQTADPVMKARDAGDISLTGRTEIWKNLMKNWKENPKHLLLGNGSGRTKWLIFSDTSISVHNAYLSFTAEFGLIGFALLSVFLCSIAGPILRVFFAHGSSRVPGGCALCMLTAAMLITGMLESSPLESMSITSMSLFFALGQLAGAGKDIKLQQNG